MTRIPFLLLLVSFFVLVSSSPCAAADPQEFRHWDTRAPDEAVGWVFNGRGWVSLDLRTKAAYALGMLDGGALLEMETAADPHVAADASLRGIRREIGSHDILTDIIPALDRFYGDGASLDIPVIEAYRYVLKRWRGVPEEELRRSRESLARRYAAAWQGI